MRVVFRATTFVNSSSLTFLLELLLTGRPHVNY